MENTILRALKINPELDAEIKSRAKQRGLTYDEYLEVLIRIALKKDKNS